MPRICNFMKCTETEINEMYLREDLPTDILLRWSKLLEYDFFRIYSQHLILYAPPSAAIRESDASKLPRFRKNIYTQEMIDFILELIEKKKRPDGRSQTTMEFRILPYANGSQKIINDNI